MGTINHSVVIATTWDKKAVEKINEYMDKFPSMFMISEPQINHYVTVVCGPDGSKEGWSESDKGDAIRAGFLAKLEEDTYEDGSSSWSWVEIEYGELGTKIIRGNCLEER